MKPGKKNYKKIRKILKCSIGENCLKKMRKKLKKNKKKMKIRKNGQTN